MPQQDPAVWLLMYDQLPPLVRWILGFLTLGLTVLAGFIMRRYHDRLVALEKGKFATRDEMKLLMGEIRDELRVGFTATHTRIDSLYDRRKEARE